MKAVLYPKPGQITITEIPTPKPAAGELLIEVEACGICGSDRDILQGRWGARFPLIAGHEYCGIVVETGPGVTQAKIGNRVAVDPNIACGKCGYCQSGKVALCRNYAALGVTRPGGFAEYSIVPEAQAFVVPADVPPEEAALVEPLSCALRGIQMGGVKSGDIVVVLGGGTMGGLLAQLSRVAGAARVIVAEPLEVRRTKLQSVGVEVVVNPREQDVREVVRQFDPEGADVVFEAAGRVDTAQQSLLLPKRGATIVFFGCAPEGVTFPLSPALVNDKELTICGSYNNPLTVAPCVQLLAAKRVNLSIFASHHFRLDEFQKAFDFFGSPDSYKLMIRPQKR